MEAARHILHSLLEEKGIAVPVLSEAATRFLVERTLASEASGAPPEALAQALAEAFDAAALAAGSADGNPETP